MVDSTPDKLPTEPVGDNDRNREMMAESADDDDASNAMTPEPVGCDNITATGMTNESFGDSSSSLRQVSTRLEQLEAESIAASLPEGFYDDRQEEKEYPVLIRKFHIDEDILIVLNIVNGAIWGVLVRKGLTVLTTYLGSYLGGLIWANFTACLVMGLAVESTKVWRRLLKVGYFQNKAAAPLYIGITTGFCGTCSSFSSMILEAFQKATNTLPKTAYTYPNSAYGIMECLSVLGGQLAVSVSGFHIGKHLVEFVDEYTPVFSERTYKLIEFLSLLIGIIGFIINIILIGVKNEGLWRTWTFSILFAPFGALLRFYLSKFLNSKVKNFPLGTFTANILGTLLLATFTLLARGKRSHSDTPLVNHVTGCQVLVGLDDGFCGALTTISTFVVELFALRTVHSYRYGFTSVWLGFIIMILLLGSYNWTLGLTNPACSS